LETVANINTKVLAFDILDKFFITHLLIVFIEHLPEKNLIIRKNVQLQSPVDKSVVFKVAK